MNNLDEVGMVRRDTKKKILIILFFLVCSIIIFFIAYKKNALQKLTINSWSEYYLIDLYNDDTLEQEFTVQGDFIKSIDLCLVDSVKNTDDKLIIKILDKRNNIIFFDEIHVKDYPSGSFYNLKINKIIKKNQPYNLSITYSCNHQQYIQLMTLDKNDNLINNNLMQKNNLVQNRNLAVQYEYLNLDLLNIYQIIMLLLLYGSIYYIIIYTKIINAFIIYLKNSNKIKLIFYCTFTTLILIHLIVGYITRGETIVRMLHPVRDDTFMDFFNSIQYGGYPYENKVIYPPLINVIYAIIGRFGLVDKVSSLNLRLEQKGLMVFGLYLILSTVSYLLILLKVKKGNEVEKVGFFIVILFSLPFLFMIERANSIIICLITMLIFVYGYDSDKTVIKHLAFICLGIAVAIKIYPVFLGLLLISEKRYKDVVVCICYGLLIFILPFGFTDGNILILLNNIINTSNVFKGGGYGVYVNLSNTLGFLSKLLDLPIDVFSTSIQVIISLIGVILVVFNNKIEKWKKVAIICSCIILCASFSGVYTLIYLLIPFIMFLDNKPDLKVINVVYILLFIFIFMPIINYNFSFLKIFQNDVYPLTFSTFIESITLIILVIMLYIDGIILWFKKGEIT